MAKLLFIIAFSLLLFVLPFSTSNPDSNPSLSSSPPLTVHSVLRNYGFPIGLLPTNVLTHSVNSTSGEFIVHLLGTCKLTLPPDNYLATYSKRITGKIVAGRIANLNGISVRAFFSWWSITGIRSNGDNLVFEVGGVSAKYPSKNFDVVPECDGKRSAS